MVVTSDSFFDWIIEILQGVNLFQAGTNYIVILGIVLVCAILISPRKMGNLKVLALPLMMGFKIIGLNVPSMFLVLGAIVFILELMSLKSIMNTIDIGVQSVSNIVNREDTKLIERVKRRAIGVKAKKMGIETDYGFEKQKESIFGREKRRKLAIEEENKKTLQKLKEWNKLNKNQEKTPFLRAMANIIPRDMGYSETKAAKKAKQGYKLRKEKIKHFQLIDD